MTDLSVVIPCLNETIETCILKCIHLKNQKLLKYYGSVDIAKNRANVIHIKGYGNAIGGIKFANGKYIIIGDAQL